MRYCFTLKPCCCRHVCPLCPLIPPVDSWPPPGQSRLPLPLAPVLTLQSLLLLPPVPGSTQPRCTRPRPVCPAPGPLSPVPAPPPTAPHLHLPQPHRLHGAFLDATAGYFLIKFFGTTSSHCPSPVTPWGPAVGWLGGRSTARSAAPPPLRPAALLHDAAVPGSDRGEAQQRPLLHRLRW